MAIDRDRAGRIVIPPEMRTKTDLSCSAPLAASFEDGKIQIRRDVAAPSLEQRGNRRIAQPATPTATTREPDLAAYIEEERKRLHA